MPLKAKPLGLTAALIPLVACVIANCSCTDQSTPATADRRDRISAQILDQVPTTMKKRLGYNFEGKVVLAGYDLDQEQVLPGEQLEVTWYWQCQEPPGAGWRLFTHVLDASGRSRLNRDDVGPVRKHFQPEHWKKGMIIADPQRIKVPAKWDSETLELKIGLWKGQKRMALVNGPQKGSKRVTGLVIPTTAQEMLRTQVPWTDQSPTIDGVFQGEAIWAKGAQLSAFVHTVEGTPAERKTDVILLWDDEKLYVAMQAADDHLQSKYSAHDDELWHEDAFELVLDPGGDKQHYYEIQVSPAGIVFDSHLPAYRQNHNDWSSKVEVQVRRTGTLNDKSDEDQGWTAEMAIPFATMSAGGAVPPVAGQRWRANFFRIDVTKAGPAYSAWSPPRRGDFHALDRFGELQFSAAAKPLEITPVKPPKQVNETKPRQADH